MAAFQAASVGVVQLVFLVLEIAFSLWSYFRGKAEAREAAAKAIAEKFAELENKGFYVMRDILVQQGRSSWVDWSQVPRVDQPPEGPSNGA